MTQTAAAQATPSLRAIAKIWWPLAASWLLMAAELPAISAVMARLVDPNISLAAYGGVVFPLALIIESPVIMLLAASTTLSKDWDSYRKIRRYMMSAGAILTVLHVLIAFTPLYYLVVKGLLGVPQEIVEPGRLGLMILLPWSWSIAYRRFNQGVLIRFGHSRDVGFGTVVRLSAEAIVLVCGFVLATLPGSVAGSVPGVAIGAGAVAAGVLSEAAFIGLRVQPVLRGALRQAPRAEPALTMPGFIAFYVPLVLTSLLSLLIEPLGSAALSRMPNPLHSLAVWPVVHGLIFMLQSVGIALNEVVVTYLDQPHAARYLRRFTLILVGATTSLLLIIVATPLSQLWFSRVAALEAPLVEMARIGLLLALPMPAVGALQSWFQGAILHSRRTRGITESVGVYMVTVGTLLLAGVAYGQITGLYAGMVAFASGMILQTAWLWFRSRPAMRQVRERDAALMV